MSVDRREPCSNTCPIIDNVIEDIKDYQKDIISEVQQSVGNLENIFSYMEDIREANSALRSWGNNLVSELEDKDKEIEELQQKIYQLEDRISELE